MRYRLVATAALLVCVVSIVVQAYSGRVERGLSPGRLVVVASSGQPNQPTHPLNLGQLRPNQSAVGALNLQNTSAEQVVTARVESSCPCLRVTPESLQVNPGETTTVCVRFDPAEEPAFRGRLGVSLAWTSPQGAILLQHEVELSVVGEPTEVVSWGIH